MSPDIIEFFNVVLRFTHVLAAIMWIGNSLLFTWMEINLIKDPNNKNSLGYMNMLHAGGVFFLEKRVIDPQAIPDKLHRFMWQSYTTWISGFLLLVFTFYTRPGTLLLDPSKSDMSGWLATLISVLSIFLFWVIYDLCWKSSLKHRPVTAIAILSIAFLGYAFWIDTFFNSRFVLLQLGAMLGTTMSANVFFVIIPNQRKMMAALLEGKPHDLELGHQAKLRSLTNHYVTFPVLFLMLSAHFPIIYGNPYDIVIMTIICVGLVVIKHMMNIYNRYDDWLNVSIATFVACSFFVGVLMYISKLGDERHTPVATETTDGTTLNGETLFSSKGCVACHQPVDSSIAPSVHRIYNQPRKLTTGESVIADEAYLRESILDANAKITQGYSAAMPGFKGALTDEEVQTLVDYIKGL